MSTQQILKVQYACPEYYFKVPVGIDLNDKSTVEMYGIKWNVLYIKYADGREVKIESCGNYESDMKRPDEVEIAEPGSAEHNECMDFLGCEDSDEEDEEEEEEEM